jgi:broad specificity phosphatase PhoE
MKNIICIRHAYSLHNKLAEEYGIDAYQMIEGFNSFIMNKGILEANLLRKEKFETLKNINIVLVSPLTRTLQTALILFDGLNKNIIALDILKEYPNGLETPNKRKKKSKLIIEFPDFNFEKLTTEHDETWNPNRFENMEEFTIRIKEFKELISNMTEQNICIVGHNDFLSTLINSKMQTLEHCKIYNVKI